MPVAQCTRRLRGANGVIARYSCLSVFGGEHPSPPKPHPVIGFVFYSFFSQFFYNVQLIRSSFFNSGRINSKRSDIAIASRGKNLLRFDRDITMIMVSPFLLPRDAVHPRY